MSYQDYLNNMLNEGKPVNKKFGFIGDLRDWKQHIDNSFIKNLKKIKDSVLYENCVSTGDDSLFDAITNCEDCISFLRTMEDDNFGDWLGGGDFNGIIWFDNLNEFKNMYKKSVDKYNMVESVNIDDDLLDTTIKVYGKTYKAKKFTNNDDANEFIELHDGKYGVIKVDGNDIYVANNKDKGK
jgi:hypothetical protein